MKTRVIALSIVTLFSIMIGCNDDSPLEAEQAALENLMREIVEMAESVSCLNSNNWTYTPIGSKPCGGPTGYLAYSLDIDTEYFLGKVEEYRIAQENMNIKHGLISDCSLLLKPDYVKCSEGKPVLVYDEDDIEMAKLYDEIIEMAESVSCVDSNNWTFTPFGSKPCGGPASYLAYSLDIDTEYFLKKVEEYRIAHQNYNAKRGIVSDCSITQRPDHVECSKGKPVLVYAKK